MTTENITVVGLQWGDEGKGKIVDALTARCRYVVRYCGGANAGHTVTVGAERYALHLVPSGILRPGVRNVIANGVVLDPTVLLEEIRGLRARGVEISGRNLLISDRAHLVMPYHRQADRLSEEKLAAGRKIGTTALGIGPCYSDKASRSTAIRVADLSRPESLKAKLAAILADRNAVFAALYGAPPVDPEAIYTQLLSQADALREHVCDTGDLLRSAIAQGERILFEGAQGTLLDVDHGTFPFVTSSSVTACGVPSGAGVPPRAVGKVLGVIKAYCTRVGGGPFPTEQVNPLGDLIRKRGKEYGTTTGRPRRCGWFDAVAGRYAADLSGVDELAVILLDVLSTVGELKVCTGYRLNGRLTDRFDPDGERLGQVECQYETLPGWEEDITACTRFEDLPPTARAYVERIETLVGRPAGIISVGPARSQTILRTKLLEEPA